MSDDFPLPELDWEPTRPFWEGAAREELLIPRCAGCRRWTWYPRDRCAGCGGERMPWTRVSGRGTLFSWAVVRRAWVEPFRGMTPYVPALVALQEDPAVRLVSNLVDCAPEDLRAEMPLEVVFRPLRFAATPREVLAPLFRPADGAHPKETP